jgi:hypothetical protein
MKKKIYRILAGTLFLLLMSPESAHAQGLTFSISFNKTVYALGEPIVCTMTLKNTGSTALVVNNRFLVNNPMGPHEVSFQITDPVLKQMPFDIKVNASSQSNYYVSLPGGAIDTFSCNLADYFDFTVKGLYKVAAFYENKLNAPISLGLPSAWKGRLRSNKLTFTIQ